MCAVRSSAIRFGILAGVLSAAVLAVSPVADAGQLRAEGAAREGYLTTSDGVIVTTGSGECWHTQWWKPEHAVEGCDPVAKAPEVKAAPPPVVPPSDVSDRVLFGFDKSQLDDEDRRTIDSALAAVPAGATIEEVTLVGHADRIGPESYNMLLSERRAKAARDYLLKVQPALAGKIKIAARGETEPKVQCADNLRWKALVECLKPNRRVEIELKLK